MKKISLKAISGVALAVILLLAAAQIPASGQNGKGSRIEGTWRVALTIRNCQTGAEINTIVFFRYNPDGTFAGTQKVTRQIELAHGFDEFTSTDSFELADPNGNVVGSGCATGAGQRLE